MKRGDLLRRIVIAAVLVICAFFLAPHGWGQDTLRSHRINSLRGLREIAIVFRADDSRRRVIEIGELGDHVSVVLRQKIPSLKQTDVNTSASWLEVAYVTSEMGGTISVSIYQWATVGRSGEKIFTKTWDGFRVYLGRWEIAPRNGHSKNKSMKF